WLEHIGLVEVLRADRPGIDEQLDVDRFLPVRRGGGNVLLLDHHVAALVVLEGLDDLLPGHLLAGFLIDPLIAHAGVVAAVEHAEAQVHAALAGHQPHRDVEQSERERACPDGPGHAVVSARSARLLRREAAFGPGFVVAAGGPAAARHPDLVLDRIVAGHGRGDVLGAMLHPAPGDLALQHHLAVLAAHLDTAGIDHRIIGQVFADLLENARVRALVTARAVPAMLAFGFVWEITEPAAVLLAPVAAPARVPCGRHVAFRGIVARHGRDWLHVHSLVAPGAH